MAEAIAFDNGRIKDFQLSVARDLDLDLVSGHTAYLGASLIVIDLYLHTKFHWNRRNLFVDGRTDGRKSTWIHFKARFDGLHAAGYNSAESEPIWMKFGKLRAKYFRLAMVDIGRDPRSSHSLRGSRNFVFWLGKQRTIWPISGRTIFTNFAHNNVNRCRDVNFLNRILKILS